MRIKLTNGDCAGAIAQITPLYNSINTDNEVRMLMADADGCTAGMNFFKVLGDIALKASTLVTGGIFSFAANEFPSTITDDIAEGAQASEDALESIFDPGTVVLMSEEFNLKTFNPGVYNPNSRLSSANAYLFFISLAAIGSIETRNDTPTSAGSPTNTATPLPWTSAAVVTADGCAFGSAVVNFADTLGVLATTLPGSLGSTIAGIQSVFQTAIYDACSVGCTGASTFNGVPVTVSGCSLSACATCPMTLRDRTSCTGVNTDPNSCAVAGIINSIVNLTGSPLSWQ